MNKKLIPDLLLSLILISVFTSGLNVQSTEAEPKAIVVPDDYATIQEAINHAVDGDTIFVKAGIYYEHVVVNKTISLLGEIGARTVVDGNETGITIKVTRSGVSISNFTVQRSGSIYWESAGIFLDNVENCTLNANFLTANPFAGLMLNQSHYCRASGNRIHDNNGVGVTMVGSSFNTLSRNNITRNGWSALTLNEETHHNIISENSMISNNLAVIGHCINLYRSQYNLIQKNTITGDDNGIRLEYWSNYNTAADNNITDNSQAGLSVEMYSAHNMIHQNTISKNGFGFYVISSTQNTIWQNNIADNDQQAYVSVGSVNNWDNGYPIGGNYWSDYVGVDVKSGPHQDLLESDAIGDIPYVIDASNRDRYPLMNPWAERKVGVEVGDWVEYGNFEVVWNSTDPDAQPPQDYDLSNSLEWTRTEVQAISGTNITFELLIRFRNGTEQIDTWNIDVKTGRGFPFYFISADLHVGDTTYEGDASYSPGPRINETVFVEYMEGLRETNHLNITRFFAEYFGWRNYSESYNFYWDRATGVLTEYSYQRSFLSGTENYATYALTSFKIFYTNLWRVRIFGDINGDNKIDIRDIAEAGLAFGSTPDHPRWNPRADLNQDGKVDIKDIATVAKNFGKTYP